MLSLAAARSLIEQMVHPLAPSELPLNIAQGCVLREDVLAPDDLPAFDRSAMDGYAIAAGDAAERFRVVMEVQPGQSPMGIIGPGECARIFTGAAIPEGASQVIMQEEVTREGEWMTPRNRDAKTWIRLRGEDARCGELLLTVGTRLRAGELSMLAQIGLVRPRVSRRPQVIHIATGNELVDAATAPGPGQIRDSNSALIAALLADTHALLVAQSRCRDGLDLLVREVESLHLVPWNVLLISGGASVGDYDFGVQALKRLGFTVHFQQVNMRPGKPLTFATKERQVAFVIPGNPVSHFVAFQVAIRLALECLEGAAPSWPLAKLPLTDDLLAKPNERETFWPVRVSIRDGMLQARPLAWQSSGDLRGLVEVNALVPLAPGTGGAKKGDIVECLLLAPDLGLC